MTKETDEKCTGDEHVLFEGAKKCECKELTKDEVIALRGCVGDEHVTVAGKSKCQCGVFTSAELDKVNEVEDKKYVSNWLVFAIGIAMFLGGNIGGIVGSIVGIGGTILIVTSVVSGIFNYVRPSS